MPHLLVSECEDKRREISKTLVESVLPNVELVPLRPGLEFVLNAHPTHDPHGLNQLLDDLIAMYAVGMFNAIGCLTIS